MIPELLAVNLVWTESSHADFADGHEYYYLGGDSATVWQEDRLWTWRIGSRIYSPASGGLRIIGQDIDIDDDGWLDLPLASWCLGPSLVYWGPHLSERSEINPGGSPSMWANGIFVADLNEDGKPELLIANEVTNEGPPCLFIHIHLRWDEELSPSGFHTLSLFPRRAGNSAG